MSNDDGKVYLHGEGVQVRIRSILPGLSKAGQRVAEYILANAQQAMYQSVTEVAEASSTSETTVIRFCQDLGFRGFHDFKLSLAQDLVVPEENISEALAAGDTLEVMVRKVLNNNMRALADTSNVLNLEHLVRAVDAVVRARKVEFYGVGHSGITALDGKYKFMRLGLLCDSYTDSHMQAMSATLLTRHDVVVGISWSGASKDVIHSMNLAKNAGATLVAITNFARSPLAQLADIVLLTASRETPLRSGALSSSIAQLHVLDLLYTAVAMRLYEQAVAMTEKTTKAVVEKLV